MALAGVTDDHQVVSTVPGGHAHAADIVFKAAGSDLGGHNALGLGVDAVKVFGGWQTDAVFERFSHVTIVEGAHIDAAFRHVSPDPALAGWSVVFEVFEDIFDIEFLVGIKRFGIAHAFTSSKRPLRTSLSSMMWLAAARTS